MTRMSIGRLVVLIGSLGAVGCSQSNGDPAAQYGARLEQLRVSSQQHRMDVEHAESMDEVKMVEQAHADRMDVTLGAMEDSAERMVGCMGSHNCADTALGDVQAMRAMHEEHHQRMLDAGDLQSAHTAETEHQQRVEEGLGVMAQHHHDMMTPTAGAMCGSMH